MKQYAQATDENCSEEHANTHITQPNTYAEHQHRSPNFLRLELVHLCRRSQSMPADSLLLCAANRFISKRTKIQFRSRCARTVCAEYILSRDRYYPFRLARLPANMLLIFQRPVLSFGDPLEWGRGGGKWARNGSLQNDAAVACKARHERHVPMMSSYFSAGASPPLFYGYLLALAGTLV